MLDLRHASRFRYQGVSYNGPAICYKRAGRCYYANRAAIAGRQTRTAASRRGPVVLAIATSQRLPGHRCLGVAPPVDQHLSRHYECDHAEEQIGQRSCGAWECRDRKQRTECHDTAPDGKPDPAACFACRPAARCRAADGNQCRAASPKPQRYPIVPRPGPQGDVPRPGTMRSFAPVSSVGWTNGASRKGCPWPMRSRRDWTA